MSIEEIQQKQKFMRQSRNAHPEMGADISRRMAAFARNTDGVTAISPTFNSGR